MITERKPPFVFRLSRSGAWTIKRESTVGPPDVSRSVKRYERSAAIVPLARSSADWPEAGSDAGSWNDTGVGPAVTVTWLGRPWRTVDCTRVQPVPQDSVGTIRPSTVTRTASPDRGVSPCTTATSTGPPG